MRLRRAAGYVVVRILVLALLVVEGSNSARKRSDARAKNYGSKYPSRSVTAFDYAKYLEEKYVAPPLVTVERLATRGLLDAYDDPDLKTSEKRTEESYRQKKKLNADEEIDVYEAEFLATLQEQGRFLKGESKTTSDETENRLATRGLLLRTLFGGFQSRSESAGKNEPKGADASLGQAETIPKNASEKTQSSWNCRSLFSRIWSFYSRPKPAEITKPAETTKSTEITKPATTKRDIDGSRWFSDKFSGRQTDATSNQQEQLTTRGLLDGIWGSPAPKAKPAEDDGQGKDPPADGDVDPGQGDYYYDDPTADQTGLPAFQEPEQIGKPEQKPEQPVTQDTTPPSSQNWWQQASRWASPTSQSEKLQEKPSEKPREKASEEQQGKPPTSEKATKTEDSSGDGWLNWGSPKPKAPEQKAKPKDNSAGAGQSGWLWGSPASPETSSRAPPDPASKSSPSGGLLSWLNGGEDEKPKNTPPKQHGPLRSLVKTVEHTIMPFKGVRRALKSIPGVRPTRKTMKATLDAVDSVVDNEYVRNIRTAAAESGKRVSAKAVGLADAVWELGTGTTDTTLNMVDTLRKESARTLDSVTVACPPTRSAVDYVKTKMADGVGFLQKENDRIRKQGKGVLSKISGGAVDTAETTAPTPASGGGWWNW